MTYILRPSNVQTQTGLLDNDTMILTVPTADKWGWLPVLSLTSAISIFLVALSYEAGRLAVPWSDALFWPAVLTLFLPITGRLLSREPSRRERIALLIALGIGLYFFKFLQYPIYFAYYDEFSHWRTAQDIAASGHLFHANPLLAISAFYPGLEIVTTTLSSLTGLSLFVSGIMVIGVAHLIMVLALYLFYEYFSNSARAAGIATLLYAANPSFAFFDASFSYESLALSLAAFVLFALAVRCRVFAGHHKGLTLMIWLGLAAVVVTHHITSFALVAFLLLWTAISFVQNRKQKGQVGPGGVALLGIVLCVVWATYTGDIVLGYLFPDINATIFQIQQILTNEAPPRHLFQGGSAFVTPLWERVMGFASVILITLGLPFGLFQIWKHRRTVAVALALAIGGLAYPVSQALRLTSAGAEAGVRANQFLFFGIAFVLAIGATQFWLSRRPGRRRSLMLLGAIAVICVGQLILGGAPDWSRIPGPYLVSADNRSIEPEGISAAEWAHSYLGPSHPTASDRINTLLMSTYGYELAFTSVGSQVPVGPVFTSPQFGSGEEAILRQDGIQYLVVDLRDSTGLPWVGTYFQGSPNDQLVTQPIDLAALTKFDNVKYVSRLFDSGDIIIYDVQATTNASSKT